MYFTYESLLRGIQKGPFKLIAYVGPWGRRFQLFNEEEDQWEMHDLIGQAEYHKTFTSLKNLLETERIKQDDTTIEQSITYWKYYEEAESK